jgi:membrane carboxypeptidase/penicillin-binding protein
MLGYQRPRRDIGFHFVDQVAREARSVAGIQTITAHSYTVRSTINLKLQRAVEEALQEGLSRYERNTGRVQFRGAEANLSLAIRRIEASQNSSDRRPAWQRALAAARLPLYDGHWTPAVLVEKPGGKKGEAGGSARRRAHSSAVDRQRRRPAQARAQRRGAVRAGAGGVRVRPVVQGMVVVLENKSGRIRHERRLFLSAEPAQPCHAGGAPARLRHQAAELSGGPARACSPTLVLDQPPRTIGGGRARSRTIGRRETTTAVGRH